MQYLRKKISENYQILKIEKEFGWFSIDSLSPSVLLQFAYQVIITCQIFLMITNHPPVANLIFESCQ